MPNATKYWYELAEDSTFGSVRLRDSSLVDTTKVLNDISANTTYYWRVKAKNIAGWGSFSQRWYFTTIITAPSAPTNLTASVISSSQINLSWQDNATNETGYKVERKTGTTGSWAEVTNLSAGSTSYTNTSLTDGTQYYYRIYAYNNAGGSGYSNETNAITPMNTPNNLTASSSSNQINLNWQDNSGSESGYRIERRTGLSGLWTEITIVGSNTTTYNNTGLNEGATYYYRVRGYNSFVISPYSNEVSITITDVEEIMSIIPHRYKLMQNYPNPFNPTSTIKYALPTQSNVQLNIYDIMGREVKSLLFDSQPAGYQSFIWDGRNNYGQLVSSGVYILNFRARSIVDGAVFQKSSKLMLLK
jgi:hypothetical protein